MKTVQTFALSAIAAALFAGSAFAAGDPNAPNLFDGIPAKTAAQPVKDVTATGATSKPTPVATPAQTVLQPVMLSPTGPAIVVPSAQVPNLAPTAAGQAVAVVEKKPAKKKVVKQAADTAPEKAKEAGPVLKGVEAAGSEKKLNPALTALNKWLSKSTGVNVEQGVVKFPYGMMEPVLVCAPERICIIELEAGEKIQNVSAGDTARWQLSPAAQGITPLVVVKVMIAPTDDMISSNLLITTDRRTYTLTLKSDPIDFVPRMGFYYPQDVVQNWGGATASAASAATKADAAPKEVSISQVDMANVNLDYNVEGDEMLKPTKVFDDGKRMYLQMSDMANVAPVVMVDDRMVNYRYRDNFYVIDMVGNKTTMLIGVGSEQRKVEITKGRRAKLFGIF